MSHKPSKAYYVEGVHRFWIDEGYVVCRIECSDYYARQAQISAGDARKWIFCCIIRNAGICGWWK